MILKYDIKPYLVEFLENTEEITELVKNDIITVPIEDLQKIDLSFFDEINFDYTETKSVVFCSEKSIKSFLKTAKLIGFEVIIKEASDMLDIHPMTIKGRLKSPKFDNYKYKD
jgi:hypothetical protein